MRRPDLTARPWHVTHPDGTKLAGPPMHPSTPSEVRVRVFEYVLTRQYGLAAELAEEARDVIERRENREYLIRSMSSRPYTDSSFDDLAVSA